MRHNRFLIALLAVAGMAPFALAQSDEPPDTPPADTTAATATQTEADLAYQKLYSRFNVLQSSLDSATGVTESDHPAIRRLLGQARDFSQRWPEHIGAVAMQIQLSKWLGEEQQSIAELYRRLMELRPDDVNLALLWIKQQEESEDMDPDRGRELYRDLYDRFPDNAIACARYAEYLRDDLRYAEAIEVLQQADLDPVDAPAVVYLLADCLFADHHFEEALATLESIPDSAIQDLQLRRNIEREKPNFTEYIDLWRREQELRAAEAEADDLPRAAIETTRGRIVVELFENEAPNTVANFIKLADSGFYAQTTFHRFLPNFMVQGGDPGTKPDGSGVPGAGNPGYYIPDEHTQENHRNHFRDSLAMAKRREANTAGCQFYLNHRPTPWLNGRHTVFGRVIEGLDVVRSLRQDDEITGIVVLRKRDHAYEPETLPITPPAPPAPERETFSDRAPGG